MSTMTMRALKEADPKAYEEWREHALDWDWWGSVYEMAKENAQPLGFRVDAIWFSDFASQGDGASWEGSVDLFKFLAHQQSDDPRWHVVSALLEDGWLNTHAGILHSGRYYHEMNMVVSYENNFNPHNVPLGKVDKGAYKNANVCELYEAIGGDSTINELLDWVQEDARDYARDIYKHLEEEYEYLTSEEMFIECSVFTNPTC